MFTVAVAICGMLLVLALRGVYRPPATAWRPNLGARPLAAIALVLLAANIHAPIARPPDDAGFS